MLGNGQTSQRLLSPDSNRALLRLGLAGALERYGLVRVNVLVKCWWFFVWFGFFRS